MSTVFLFTFVIDAFFSLLTAPAYLYLFGIDDAAQLGPGLWWIAGYLLLKSSAMQLFLFIETRPLARWLRVRDTPAASNTVVSAAARVAYTVADRAAVLITILWLLYPVVLWAVAGARRGQAFDRHQVIVLLLAVGSTVSTLVIAGTIVGTTVSPKAADLSLVMRARGLPSIPRVYSLPTRLLLAVTMVAFTPTVFLAALAYVLAVRGGGSLGWLLLFGGILVAWIPFVSTLIVRAILRPLLLTTQVLGAISSERDATKIKPLPVYYRDRIGDLIDSVNLMTDRLALSAAERQELDEFKSEFVRVAAHELKTPVTVVRGYSEVLLASDGGSPEQRRRLAEAIVRGADRMQRIVEDLVELSQLELGRLRFSSEQVELRALVDAEVASRVAEEHGRHQLVVEGEPSVAVQGSRGLIKRVIRSLVDNALRYSPDGGAVEVSLRRQGAEIVVTVRDHGVGIPEAKQARIFESFYRAHTDTAYDYGGFGTSLFAARQIIERHGGRIWFESEEGKGSSFSFALPAA